MFILLNTGTFDPDVADVSGIPTTKTEAKLGAKIWTDRDHYRISEINNELLGATLFKSAHYRHRATMSVTANKKAAVYVALYEPRDGGLMQVLQTDGWELTSHELAWIDGPNTHKLNKIWTKQVNAGSTISFTSTKDSMTFAILVKEGKYCFI